MPQTWAAPPQRRERLRASIAPWQSTQQTPASADAGAVALREEAVPEYRTVNKPLAWFRANEENYRAHPEPQVERLRESLRRFGVFKNVVARPDGTVLAGHGVVEAALAEGLQELPAQIFEGSDAEARALMVADNELSRLAQDDPDQLSQLLDSLRADGLMQVTGHDDASLQGLLEEVAAQAPPTGFLPVSAEEQGRLDQLEPKWVQCPNCGETFDSRQAAEVQS